VVPESFAFQIMPKEDHDAVTGIELNPISKEEADQKHEVGEDQIDSDSTRSSIEKRIFATVRNNEFARTCWRVVTWTPKRCRWDPESPPKFNMGLNLLFGFACTFTVANLYYNHPILNILAQDFGVSDERASVVPTLMQAGYASGLLFLCPLGDVFRRRAFILILVFFTATMVSLLYSF
jgi:hypothetical protein